MVLKSTCGIDKNAKIKGVIRQSYCLNCNKIVKNYKITEYPQEMPYDEVIGKIKKGMDNQLLKVFEDYPLVTIEIYDKYEYESISKKSIKNSLLKRIRDLFIRIIGGQDSLFIVCPKCNSYLNINNSLKKFPICNKKIIHNTYLCD